MENVSSAAPSARWVKGFCGLNAAAESARRPASTTASICGSAQERVGRRPDPGRVSALRAMAAGGALTPHRQAPRPT